MRFSLKNQVMQVSKHKYRLLILSHFIRCSTELTSANSFIISKVSDFLQVVFTLKILIEKSVIFEIARFKITPQISCFS